MSLPQFPNTPDRYNEPRAIVYASAILIFLLTFLRRKKYYTLAEAWSAQGPHSTELLLIRIKQRRRSICSKQLPCTSN